MNQPIPTAESTRVPDGHGQHRRVRLLIVALLRIGGSLLLILGLTSFVYYLVLRHTHNVACVVAGLVYRSGQMPATDLRDAIATYHVRSVLNLRGTNRGKPWYDDEVQTCASQSVEHLDYGISARHLLTPDRCAELLRLVAEAPKPLLIHCEAGADRTGLASALVLLTAGVSPGVAHRQLSLWHLHFPYCGSLTMAMDRSFDDYVATLVAPNHPQDSP